VDRVFLDANVLFSAAYRTDSRLTQLWRIPKAKLCSSHYALEEARINLENEGQRERLAMLSREVQLSSSPERPFPSEISLPDKDKPILPAAIAAEGTHLLTGDIRHFGSYFGEQIEGITILPPAEYLRRRGPR